LIKIRSPLILLLGSRLAPSATSRNCQNLDPVLFAPIYRSAPRTTEHRNRAAAKSRQM